MSVCVICESSPSGTMCAYHSGYKQGHAAGQALGEKSAIDRIVAFLDKRVDWHWEKSQNDPDADQRTIHQSRGAGIEFAQMDIEAGEHLRGDHIASGAHDAGGEGVKDGAS